MLSEMKICRTERKPTNLFLLFYIKRRMKPLIKNLREIIVKRDVPIISFLLLCGLFLKHGCDPMYLFMTLYFCFPP